MTLAQTIWTHGHSLQVEYPERGTIEYKGFSAKYKGNTGKPNWFHFAIPTPVDINDKLQVGSVSLRFRGGGAAFVESIHVYDGEKKIAGEDKLHLRPTYTQWDIYKVDVPIGQEISSSLGISVLVNFGVDDLWIEFSAAGAEFLSSGYSDNVINVRQFGAKGDGRDDPGDTEAIQSAVDFAATHHSGIVFVPEGTYMINALKSINLPSNLTFQLSPRATLKAIPNSSPGYSVLKIYNRQNVTVTGGTIQGERGLHTGTTGEWGMGVDIRSSMNVTIRDVIAKDCWGDGFYIGKVTGSKDECHNVKLQNCIADNNRRQGCSVVSLIGGFIEECLFSNTNGTAPEAGLDIETNPTNIIRNINVSNCIFSGNIGHGVRLDGGKAEVSSCILSGNICQNNNIGIGVYIAKEIVVVNNLCQSNKEDGINIYVSTDINTVNNLCTDNGVANVKVESVNVKRSTNCGIQGNTCRGLKTSKYGVYVDKESSNTFVCNNDLLNSATNPGNNFVNLSQSTEMVNNRV